jgi:hypothetical protein
MNVVLKHRNSLAMGMVLKHRNSLTMGLVLTHSNSLAMGMVLTHRNSLANKSCKNSPIISAHVPVLVFARNNSRIAEGTVCNEM